MEQALIQYPPKTAQERAVLDQAYLASRGMLTKWQNDVRGIAEARIVEFSGAGLYPSSSNEADIIRELRVFAASLPR